MSVGDRKGPRVPWELLQITAGRRDLMRAQMYCREEHLELPL